VGKTTVDVGSFEAHLRSVVLPIGLRLDSVLLRGQSLHVEGKPFSAHVPKPGTMTVTVSQENLAAYLNEEAPGGLRDFDITVQGGRLIVQATKSMLIDVRATAVCTLRIVNGKELYVDLETVEVFGGGGLTNMVRSQLEAINPIFDVQELPLDAVLTNVEAEAGQVVLHGLVEPK
jgi:hypothetical protein